MPTAASISRRQALGGKGAAALVTAVPSWARLAGHTPLERVGRTGECISSEHTQMRKLSAFFGLTLDNVNRYRPHTRAADYRLRFNGRFWSQAALDREWREWARELFLDAATKKAPWPTLYNQHTKWARRWDHMSAAESIDHHIPGGLRSDFG